MKYCIRVTEKDNGYYMQLHATTEHDAIKETEKAMEQDTAILKADIIYYVNEQYHGKTYPVETILKTITRR